MTAKRFVFVLLGLLFLSHNSISQSDTLHIYYRGLETKILDSTEAKIAKWAKSLNGKKVDIEVISYYNDAQFKKYSQERCDELFIIVNRKARELINITFIGPKKGAKSQRSMADIVYRPFGSAAAAAAASEEKKKTEKAVKAGGVAVVAGEAAETKKAGKPEKTANEEKKTEKSAKKEEEKTTENKKEKTEGQLTEGSKGKEKDKKKKEEGKAKQENTEVAKNEETKVDEEAEEKAAEASGKYPYKRMSPKIGVNGEDIALIKSSKIILTTSSARRNINKMLREAVKNYWTFNQNITVMPYDSAAELAKNDPGILLMFVTKIVTKTVTHSSGRAIQNSSWAIMLEKGKKKPVFTSFFPVFEGSDPFRQEMINVAVIYMNCLFSNMDTQGIKKMKSFNTAFEKDAPLLKDRTLLITAPWLNKNINPDEVGNYYHGKFQIVSYQKLADAINQKQPFAYIVPVPYNSGGQERYYDYLMDAETGKVYYIKRPSSAPVMNIADPLGNVYFVGVNERITSKDLEKYNKAFEKKDGKDEEETVEEKSKEGEK